MSPVSDTIFSQIDTAERRVARLAARNDAVTDATKKRDVTLYALFHDLHELDKELHELDRPESLKMLKARYGLKLPKVQESASFLVNLICSDLNARTRTKYAATLRYIREKKKQNQKVRDFVRLNGGINGCVKGEKKLRTALANARRENPSRKRSRSR